MPTSTPADRRRRLLPNGLTGLAGAACLACCLLPPLIAAGVLSGTAWAVVGAWMPGIALILAASAAALWWGVSRRHRAGCSGGDACSCGG